MVLKDFVAENVDLGTVTLILKLSPLQEALKLAERLENLTDEKIDINIDKHREKRSLNANAYERVLEGKIADVLGTSKDEVHNLMLARYGQYMRDKDNNIVFCLMPASIEYEKETEIHLKPTGRTEDRNGMPYCWFAQMKPSHEYDTKEMAILIDGVISEAKDLDIETLSPDEIKRMVETNGQGFQGGLDS